MVKKRLRCYPEEQQRNPESRRTAEAIQGERQPLHVHAPVACFVSRSVRQRCLPPGRHGLTSASLSLIPEGTRCRSVFVLVAFPPPPVYVLDNEAQPKLSGVRYPEADHLLSSAVAFLSARLGRICRFILRKPFGFGGSVSGSNLTAGCCPQASRRRNACRSPRRSRLP